MTGLRRRARLTLVVVGLLWLSASGLSAAQQLAARLPGSLEGIPEPVVENFEQSVRDQLSDAWRRVEDILARETEITRRGDALGQLGALFMLYSFHDTARPMLRQARELQPEDFRWPYFLALMHQFDGDFEAGLENARRSAELKPEDAASHLRLADFAYELEKPREAREHYALARDLGDPSGAGIYGLARLLLDEDRASEALPLLEEAVTRQPPGSVINYHLGQAYRKIGDRERARAALRANESERIIFPDPLYDALALLNRSREAIFSRGVEALRKGEPEAAMGLFGQLVEMNPEDAEAHYNIGMSLVELGRKGEAEEYLRKATELRDDYRDAYYNLGLVLGQRGAHAESEALFRRTTQIDPEDLEVRVRLANAMAEQNRENEAVQQLVETLALDPGRVDAKLLLGIVEARRGHDEEAAAHLEAILDLAPGVPQERAEAHYHLALLGPPTSTREEIVTHLEAALELDPEAVAPAEALAAEAARRGEFAVASAQFEKLIRRRPEDGRLHLSRAMAYLLGGDDRGAARALEDSLERLGPVLQLRHLQARLFATAADEEVRQPQRALELAQALVQERLTLEHGETMAMALASVGRFSEAARWQKQVLAQESSSGEPSEGRLARLRRYEAGEAVLQPWLVSGRGSDSE